ncbi:MAG: aldo/keto reductase [Phycisphaeraceae bacterium]|nr:aldo/keto reductase [Phycisphaeraceae bacterium]
MKNESDNLTRRKFMRDGAMVSAGLASGIVPMAVNELNAAQLAEISRTRSYNPQMEYRRLGKTGLWISAVSLGGHWKRIDKIIGSVDSFASCENMGSPSREDMAAFDKNRYDVVSRCIDVGINLVDFAGCVEPEAYGRALKGRRESMYTAWSLGGQDMRHPEHRKAPVLIDLLKDGLKRTGLEYADIWRIMMLERGSRHTEGEVHELIRALETARKQGLCRFTGISTHDRTWAKMLIEKYPDAIEVLLTPYTADSRELPKDSLFATVRKHDVGILGIKPFASNSLFKGNGSPDSPHAEEDDRRAQMAIRHILSNPAITAPIPGLVSIHQVNNMAKAIKQRRRLDMNEKAQLKKATDEMWANLPDDYTWLNDWKYV